MNGRIDSRDKKPNLWSIAVLAGIAAAIVGILVYGGAEKNIVAICVICDLFFLAVLILLAAAFVGQLQYNPYSYNTIYYTGFALFDLSVLITHIVLTMRILRHPGVYPAVQLLTLLSGSAKNYMLLSFPFILSFSAVLCISNISLIRHEGKRFVNVLGIILSFLLVSGALLLYWFDFAVSGSQRQVMIHDLIANLFAAVYLYFECMLIGAIIVDIIAACHEIASILLPVPRYVCANRKMEKIRGYVHFAIILPSLGWS